MSRKYAKRYLHLWEASATARCANAMCSERLSLTSACTSGMSTRNRVATLTRACNTVGDIHYIRADAWCCHTT